MWTVEAITLPETLHCAVFALMSSDSQFLIPVLLLPVWPLPGGGDDPEEARHPQLQGIREALL